MINGHMQQVGFNLISILQHAATAHGSTEVVTNSVEGGKHSICYSEMYERTAKLANSLQKMGLQQGDRIGTMAWNTWRHLECWYAIGGSGAVCHTLNPRLFADQIDFIVNHAEDRFIFVDISFVPVIAAVIDRLPTLEQIVVMTDAEHMPDTSAFTVPVHCYEDLIADEQPTFDWPEIDENGASSLCYTSGTTGNPKGVMYSHRSNVMHSLSTCGPDVFNLKATDTCLMIVPMFHANSWGLAFSAPMIGSKLVLPGPHMDGASIYNLITEEQCTNSAAVPTVWTGLLDYMDAEGKTIPSLKETVIGGSAVPRSMIEKFDEAYGVDVIHAWGMTEMSPLGTMNRPLAFMNSLTAAERMDIRCKQGRAPYGVEMKIVDDEGNRLPHDGEAFGRLLVRGIWVIERYYKQQESELDADGWFDTGDVANIDKHGYMQITDRSKDIIKSGGEWISSVDIENLAMGHPELQIAACIGVKHVKWEERPLLLAVKKPGCEPSKQDVLDYIAAAFAKWQVPDDVVFIDEMPLTATGKIDKKPLRAEYESFYL
ncbi:MAG: long-chain fatty acid--CoA ligase [Pseudomonadales bacterium]